MKCQSKGQHIISELGSHLPYTIFGAVSGLIIMGLFTFFAIISKAEYLLPEAGEELFHIFHAAHILLSAVATTAMFWKYEKRFIKTLFVGFAGSIAICFLSDILLPYLGGLFFATDMRLHVCILTHPHIIVPFAIIGIAAGFFAPGVIEKSTEFSHSMHILVSSMASILYLISFGVTGWFHMVGAIFFITIVAVMLPCCLSDIAFPLSFLECDRHTS